MADAAGHVLYLNPQARHTLGVGPEDDVASLTVLQMVPAEDHSALRQRWPMLLERGSWKGQSAVHPLEGSPTSRSPRRRSSSTTPHRAAVRDGHDPARHPRPAGDEQELRDLANQRARLLHRLVQAQEDERRGSPPTSTTTPCRRWPRSSCGSRCCPPDPDRAPELTDNVETLQQTVPRHRTAAAPAVRPRVAGSPQLARRRRSTEAAAFVLTEVGIGWRVTGD